MPLDIQESGCWEFVDDGAIDDGTAKITEICVIRLLFFVVLQKLYIRLVLAKVTSNKKTCKNFPQKIFASAFLAQYIYIN